MFYLKTQRLELVPLSLEHLEAIHSLLSDRELTRLMVFNPRESLDETREYLISAVNEREKANPGFLEFVLFFNGEVAGDLTLYFFPEEPEKAEFAWIVSKKYCGRGFAAEAAKALMAYYSENCGIKRFIALCDSENAPSIALAKKLGMSYVSSHGGRFNRLAPTEERTEHLFELAL